MRLSSAGVGVGESSGGKDALSRALGALKEMGVAHRALDDQADGSAEQGGEVFLQIEELFEILLGRELVEFDQEVDVAAQGLEGTVSRRAKDVKAPNEVFGAQCGDGGGMRGNRGIHGRTVPN